MFFAPRFSLFACCFLVFLLQQLHAQTNDTELWTGANITLDLPKKMELTVEQQLRFKHNITTFRNTHTNVDFSYDINKRFSVGMEYRFRLASDVSGTGDAQIRLTQRSHRIAGQLGYRSKKFAGDWFRFSARVKYQRSMTVEELPENYIRGKAKLTLLPPELDLKPYIANEWFYRISNKGSFFDQYRLQAGLSYDWSKQHETSVFYMRSQQINQAEPTHRHIVGCEYSYKLKWKKRK